MSVTQILSVLNISTSTTHDVLAMGTNAIIAMNEGLHCGENLDRILLNKNQVRNYGIKYYVIPDDHKSKSCIEADDQLNNPLQVKDTKEYFTKFDTDG